MNQQMYYAVTHDTFTCVSEALWRNDDLAGRERTTIHVMFFGLDGWIWSPNPERHALLQQQLDRMELPYRVTTERGTSPFAEPLFS
jgi:hypothetical protein